MGLDQALGQNSNDREEKESLSNKLQPDFSYSLECGVLLHTERRQNERGQEHDVTLRQDRDYYRRQRRYWI